MAAFGLGFEAAIMIRLPRLASEPVRKKSRVSKLHGIARDIGRKRDFRRFVSREGRKTRRNLPRRRHRFHIGGRCEPATASLVARTAITAAVATRGGRPGRREARSSERRSRNCHSLLQRRGRKPLWRSSFPKQHPPSRADTRRACVESMLFAIWRSGLAHVDRVLSRAAYPSPRWGSELKLTSLRP
jgi:hypothetical protein